MSGLLRRALDTLAGPVVSRAPARDSMVLQHGTSMGMNNPASHFVEGQLVAPSLAVRQAGLPSTAEPRFGTQTWYLDPDVLRQTRIFGADAYTPSSERVWRQAPTLGGNNWNETLDAFWGLNPIRNNESIATNPVPVNRGSLLAGMTPEYNSIDTAIEGLRGRLLADTPIDPAPFTDWRSMRDQLALDWGAQRGRFMPSGEVDNVVRAQLESGGGLGRGHPSAGEATRLGIENSVPANLQPMLRNYLEEQLTRPVTYAEAKATGFVPLDAVRAVTGSHYTDATASSARELFNLLGREVPVAPGFHYLPSSALRRIMFSGGGVAPWMLGLGGENE